MSHDHLGACIGLLLGVVGTCACPLIHAQVDKPKAAAHAPTIEDMLHLRKFDALAVSPDGRWVAYVTSTRLHRDGMGVRTRMDLLDLQEHSRKSVPLGGGVPRMLKWSPSGRALGFLCQSGKRTRLCRYSPRAVGSDQVDTVMINDSLGGDVVAYSWGTTDADIAYLAREPQSAPSGPAQIPSQSRLVLFRDSAGEYTGPTSRTYVKDSAGVYVAVTRLRGAPARVVARHIVSWKVTPTIEWSASRGLIVGGPPIGVGYWEQITKWELYIVDPRSGASNPVLPQGRGLKDARLSPSGRWVAYLNSRFLPEVPSISSNYTVEVQDPSMLVTKNAFPAETDGLSLSLPPMWGADDNVIYVGRYQRATARLCAIDLGTGRWRALTPDTLSVSRYAVSRDGRMLLAVLESADQPQEIFRIDPGSGAVEQLTYDTNAFLDSLRLGHVDQVVWPSDDSRFMIHGFLVKPPGFEPTHHYPLVVLVHGGPGALFTNSFIDINFAPIYVPPQLLASAGYLVLLVNPRGDPSYGKAFAEALHGDWGPGPLHDLEAGVRVLVRKGMVDSNAVGIAGASYGGYLTAYAITQTNSFAAASINDGPTDLVSEYGQNYATRSSMAKAYFGGPPWVRRNVYDAQSPITFVDRVKTPVLMRYGGSGSTGDQVRQSYMLAQGFEFYAGLRDMGVPVEFVLHPFEGHGITSWDLYKDWIARNLRWFDFWLRDVGANPAGHGNGETRSERR